MQHKVTRTKWGGTGNRETQRLTNSTEMKATARKCVVPLTSPACGRGYHCSSWKQISDHREGPSEASPCPEEHWGGADTSGCLWPRLEDPQPQIELMRNFDNNNCLSLIHWLPWLYWKVTHYQKWWASHWGDGRSWPILRSFLPALTKQVSKHTLPVPMLPRVRISKMKARPWRRYWCFL